MPKDTTTKRSNWSPAFLRAIGTFRPELEQAADEMMEAIRRARTRGPRPRLRLAGLTRRGA